MKPFYVVLLMGAAAVGGGLVVRYSDHPVEITMARQGPPTVLAPPIPPTARVGPSSSVPVRSAPLETHETNRQAPDDRQAPEKIRPEKTAAKTPPEKPSAFSVTRHAADPNPSPSETRPEQRLIARVKIPAEPPAVVVVEHSTVAPAAAPVPAPTPVALASAVQPPPVKPATPTPPAPPEANHATLKAGMLITVRINEALSSNLNSPGDVFSGRLEKPLVADGFVIAERGAHVRGEVVDSKSAGRASELAIRLREIQASDGQRVHIVSGPWRKSGAPSTGNAGNVYDVALTRDGAAYIRPATAITFRLDQTVELTEKH